MDVFHPITTADMPQLNAFFEDRATRLCNDSAGAAVMWQPYFQDAAAKLAGETVLREVFPGFGTVYTPPRTDAAYAALEALSREKKEPLQFFPVTAAELPALRARYPEAEEGLLRDWCDYLYDAQDMVTFPGKRFHGQRNHVNKFDRVYPGWSFEDITAENLPEVRAYFEDHAVRYRKDSETALVEEQCVRDFLANYDAYAPLGGVLRVDGKIVGFSCGEVVGDTLIIHIEKADIAYDGVYQKLVQCFARRFVTENVKFINREEDAGDAGMRQSKESYHPVALLEKYLVSVR